MLSNTLHLATVLAFSLLTSTPPSVGQDLSGLPSCAMNCLATALASNGKICAASDFSCLCKNHDFVTASNNCYFSSCPAGDLVSAQTWGVKSCASAGVQIATSSVATAAGTVATGVTNAAGAAATGVANAANNTANALGGNKTTTTGGTTLNNNTAATTKPKSAAAALSGEAIKAFAITSALVSSFLMI